ncbi:alpha-glucan family phosphorylase [Phycisphaerales bacterium ac7]
MLHAGQANIRSFRVVPNLPKQLEPLREIAHNLWWTWHPEAVELFVRLDRELWESTGHNPVKLLGSLDQQRLERIAQDRSFLHALSLVHSRFAEHKERATWFDRQHADLLKSRAGSDEAVRIAYFSAEFGLTECFQIYSGGLGVLAGDHLKSSAELGIPLCGVGLLYRCGYFHQYLNADGYQQETYPDLDFPNQPIRRLIDPETNEQYRVKVELPGREVTVGIWQCDVGRVPLYLLDTNFPENNRADRDITKNLYGGDVEMRIQQEIILGIGGTRALAKIGERPTVYHINEGHAAFLSLERIRTLREQHGVSFEAAREAAAANNVFTTHTPVPAGIDRFSPDLVERYLGHTLAGLGTNLDHLLSLGRANPFDRDEFFSMAILALRCSQFANGVSKLHGHVSRDMWRHIWPEVPEQEVPIGHVTNGVHARSWISRDLSQIYDRYLGHEWQLDAMDHKLYSAVNDIPDEELWSFRQQRRQSLITWCRNRIRTQLTERNATPDEIETATGALDPNVFTIGFARRFATYKRGTLLMSDVDRLRRLFTNHDRPVQLLIAGKAHPADRPGKELIRELVKLSESEPAFRRIVFLEDYDMDVARRMIQGCDLWLNTPRRGMEASGTSGMKAAMNGCINCSILDGWWDEAYRPELGFAIGKGEYYDDHAMEDAIESRALYDLLERQILPEFYSRNQSGVPKTWIARVKACMRHLTPEFSTNRMVADYTDQYYVRAHAIGRDLHAEGLRGATELSQQVGRLRHLWQQVAVKRVETDAIASMPITSTVRVNASIQLGELRPNEVRVQLYTGEVTSLGDIVHAGTVDMRPSGGADEHTGLQLFTGEFRPTGSGRRGFAVRVVPRDERIVGTLIPGLITWDKDAPTVRIGESNPAKSTSPVTASTT